MICARCAHAADEQLGEEEHCDAQPGPDAQCDCQHRTDRYRPTTARKEATVVVHIHPDPPHIVDAIRDLRRNRLGRG
ncbi:hypothetical protein ABT124_03325 [Streptomyces sp. NPDC001982]|uniref:hypothetical protein n=1 Tax=Streptomyces sp. NPDC001982 TaxID=3154405 RepID=UPI00331A4E8A